VDSQLRRVLLVGHKLESAGFEYVPIDKQMMPQLRLGSNTVNCGSFQIQCMCLCCGGFINNLFTILCLSVPLFSLRRSAKTDLCCLVSRIPVKRKLFIVRLFFYDDF
jgi:hypothetical protein